MPDKINHPSHYGSADDPYEAIKVIDAWGLGFALGNTVKYIRRAGLKGHGVPETYSERRLEDLKKAAWYLQHEIATIEASIVAAKSRV